MTTVVSYQSAVQAGQDGLWRLLRAEWTKFRTVRGWVIAIALAPVLSVVLAVMPFVGHSPSCHQQGTAAACPPPQAPPTGPGGDAVVDTFYFAHETLTGNGAITVRLASLTGKYAPNGVPANGNSTAGYESGVQPWSKAGIMVSAGTAQGSAYAAMLATGSNGVRMQWNYTGDTAGLPGRVSASSPRWLRLVRSGDTVTGYDSADGTRWTQVDRVTLSGLPRSAQVGMFATSPDYQVISNGLGTSTGNVTPSLATGTFDHVDLAWGRAGASTAWTGTSVGDGNGTRDSPAVGGPFAGTFTQAGTGTGKAYTVTGSGDIAPDVPGDPDGAAGQDRESLLSTVIIGLIVMIIVAALFITAEYRRGLIRLTFAASPRRGRVLAAKVVVVGAVTFAAGLIGAVVALLLGTHLMRSAGNAVIGVPALTQVRMAVGAGAMLAIESVLALALGTLVRRGVTAVTLVIVVIFVPFFMAVFQGLLPLSAVDWLLRISPAAAFAVVQDTPAYHQVFTQYTPAGGFFPLPWWAGLAVAGGWTVAALAGAACALRRRDA
jgi:ABC-type transport system involved in multi-copper enzyme maturation permease subunit